MPSTPYDITLGGSTTVKQIRSCTHNVNGTVVNAFGSGEVAPAQLFQGNTPQTSAVSTTDLGTVLGLNTNLFISSGLYILSGNTDVPYRKRASGGTYAAGGSHTALRGISTLVTPDTINAAQGESATLDFTLRHRSTQPTGVTTLPGETPPTTEITGATLSAAAAVTAEYMLHSVKIAGTAVPSVQSVTITPGISVMDQFSGGLPYPTDYFISEVVPTIEITTDDLESASGLLEAAGLGSGVTVYLAKRSDGGVFVDTTTSVHIAITAAAGLQQATTLGGDSRSNSSGTIRINAKLLTASMTAAIS